jgi:hypothetical protein
MCLRCVSQYGKILNGIFMTHVGAVTFIAWGGGRLDRRYNRRKKYVDGDPTGKLSVMCYFYSKTEQKIRIGTYVIAYYL